MATQEMKMILNPSSISRHVRTYILLSYKVFPLFLMLKWLVVNWNKQKWLQGYLLGNPITEQGTETTAQFRFAHGMALISDELYEVRFRTLSKPLLVLESINDMKDGKKSKYQQSSICWAIFAVTEDKLWRWISVQVSHQYTVYKGCSGFL